MKHPLWFVALAGIVLGACSSEADGKPTGAECPTDSTLTYSSFGTVFMARYCLRCHSQNVSNRHDAPAASNFDTVDQIRDWADEIDLEAGSGPDSTNTGMPEDSPKPTKEERKQLSEWLACGAPQ